MAHGLRHFMHGDGSMAGWFGDPAHYERFTARIEAPLRHRVAADVAALALPPGAQVLDVGTGPGLLPIEIAACCPQLRVTGIDVSPAMVAHSRTAIPAGSVATVELADVAALPYPDGGVDLVVSTLSQHHWPDLAGGLRELARVLAPGGRVWIYDVRRALRTAQVASAVAFPGRTVRLDRVEAGLLGRFLARLAVEPGPGVG
jgi:ubiquinone/menaquinone biosynthesis C-methylase UbiE